MIIPISLDFQDLFLNQYLDLDLDLSITAASSYASRIEEVSRNGLRCSRRFVGSGAEVTVLTVN
jgi:hypothetical protein